ncbi:glycosyltransferase [Bradyrhizobium sp. WYCCWR 13023]|uniref:Glycosyltransferase n=1 Tax=Bradyrhizobium zhengyangense TaxID=2911009 RepID=A0A9X1RMJ6_9BRAD|nr:glycosyltransferase [Bradyrhizobium zhengyangense]
MEPKKHRVLVIAESANPEWTSVPLVGWKLSHALSKVADVHLVTNLRNRAAVLRQGLVEGRDFTAIDNEAFAGRFLRLAELLGGQKGKGWTTRTAVAAFAYYAFEFEVWRQFSARLKAGEFDLVHRVTPLSPTSPSILAKRLSKINVPFVLGPLNGGLPWPKNFRDVQYAEREWLSHLRQVYKCLPGYDATRRYSSAIIVGSHHTHSEMPNWAQRKCVYIPENAVDSDLVDAALHRGAREKPLVATFVGRLVPYKGADILIEAAAMFVAANQLKVHIVGDGPQRRELEDLVRARGIEIGVELHGWLDHSEAQRILQCSDMMVLPSIREFGGGVVVEAMAQGVTPIVADYGGPAELVDDSCGIRVPFSDRKSLVDGIRAALGTVIATPEVLDSYAQSARKKVAEELTWNAKAKQVLRIYNAILASPIDSRSLDLRAVRLSRPG